jgi:Planctomycete cytochrome C
MQNDDLKSRGLKMNLQLRTTVFLLAINLCGLRSSRADELSQKVLEIFGRHCGECHRDSDEGGMNYIINIEKLIERKKIVPGDLDASRIWLRLNNTDDPMPPEGWERPSADELKTIEQWILALPTDVQTGSAPAEPTKTEEPIRKTVANSQVITAVHEYLADMPEEDRRAQRFFVINHLHNLPSKSTNTEIGIDQSELNATRAAISKAINSLTWSSSIVVPRMIDPDQTVLAIDIRDLEWDANVRKGRPDLWNIIAQEYTYALKHDQYPDAESSQRKAREIYDWTGSDIPWFRGDWFVATALQPQLYQALLYDAVFEEVRRRKPQPVEHADGKKTIEQPFNTDDLFRRLNVDVIGNLQRHRAVRSAFTRSGVSSQPRLLERHPALYGSIWNSYDFKRGNTTSNLNARPLGPDGIFDSARFSRFSFRHDGGEYIYGLPNGLQGYLLSDGKGARIPFGPPDVVEDRKKTLGNGIIVNGVSCIACHQQGLIVDFRDEVRFGITGLPSEARRLVRNLYLDAADMQPMINRDQQRFRAAAIESMNPFLAPNEQQRINGGGDLIEPVGPVAKRFLVDTIDLTTMATELEVSPETLKTAIQFNEGLQRLGLTSVANGGTINREIWQQGDGLTTYQRVAQILKTGTPTSIQTAPWRGK